MNSIAWIAESACRSTPTHVAHCFYAMIAFVLGWAYHLIRFLFHPRSTLRRIGGQSGVWNLNGGNVKKTSKTTKTVQTPERKRVEQPTFLSTAHFGVLSSLAAQDRVSKRDLASGLLEHAIESYSNEMEETRILHPAVNPRKSRDNSKRRKTAKPKNR